MLSSLEVLNGRAHPVIAKDDLRKAAKILIYRSRKKIRSKIRKPPKLLLPGERGEHASLTTEKRHNPNSDNNWHTLSSFVHPWLDPLFQP
jgi:hypothetical protein